MAKQAKHEGFIDSLPDSILCHILSFLPTKDAVRTSILSSRWRYLFTLSISKLDFSDCLSDSQVPKEHTNFKNFVDRLFFNPKYLRLECFRVNDLWVYDGSVDELDAGFLTIYNWLCAALWRGVKEIDIHLFTVYLRRFPTRLFTCSSLVTLKLHFLGGEMKVPINVCLPNLGTLRFSDMEFVDGCSFLRLISGCPVLVDLGLFNCFLNDPSELNIHSLSLQRLVLDYESSLYVTRRRLDSAIVIDAPSLVYFRYFCFVVKVYTLRDMESLENVDITIFLFRDEDHERSATLLQGISNVQVLHLTIHDYVPSHVRTPLDSVLAFPNLVELEFKNPRGDSEVSVTTWIVEFLHCAPNLNTLVLDLADAGRVFESPPEEVPSCLLYQLKEISIVAFKGDTHMFEMVSYFLNHSLVLEKLVMKNIDVPHECRSSILEKLSSLPMNSKKCELVTN